MIPVHTVFGGSLVFFGLVGSMRGWAKEVIVAFSVVLALFVEHVLLTFVPPVGILFQSLPLTSQFYIRAGLFILITIFGYATPKMATQLGPKLTLKGLPDILLGFFMGLLNGFLIAGTLLSFLGAANYGVPLDQPGAPGMWGIIPPAPDSPSVSLMAWMPPELIVTSNAVLYIAVAAAFVFVIVVFI